MSNAPGAAFNAAQLSLFDKRDHNGNTPLIVAAIDGDPALVRSLIEKGVNIDGCNRNGNTALTLAIANNRIGVVRCLIELGADLDNLDYPYNDAEWMEERGKVALAQILREAPEIRRQAVEKAAAALEKAAAAVEKSLHDAVVLKQRALREKVRPRGITIRKS